ncbi:hypothetical protein MVEN_02562400 [Mycena venus]|uniref:Uncharacterized protein n=1 Tax=Mycena venus TaxID=2733690 RepID=A0A8H6U3V1_9AGAR|nr:hypothetical protein MVEN_02562400 [Mycena venus]
MEHVFPHVDGVGHGYSHWIFSHAFSNGLASTSRNILPPCHPPLPWISLGISSTALDFLFRPPDDVTLNRRPFYSSVFRHRRCMTQLRNLGLDTIGSVLRAGGFCGWIARDDWDMFGPDVSASEGTGNRDFMEGKYK